jgi:hypothetical protein
MGYLPGVPDMGPKPVSPTIASPSKVGVGKPTGISATAHSVGKPGNTQHFGSVVGKTGKGISALGGGNPAAHAFNQYGKPGKGPGALGGAQITGGVDPTAHKGSMVVRGQSGAMRPHVRMGGLGPGKESTPGPSDTDYSMQSGDTE